MRVHTTLTLDDLYRVEALSGAPISFETLTEHRSRSHARAFEVRLSGSGGRNNTGLYGAGDYDAATWDEWGAFFGALYSLDDSARCGGTAKNPTYRNAEHYHHVTGHRFEGRSTEPGPCSCAASIGRKPADGSDHWGPCRANVTTTHLPADTHPRHRWVAADGGYINGVKCGHKGGCSATLPADRHNSMIGA